MATTLEKIKLLERYVAIDNASVDPVLDLGLDKLLAREIANTRELKSRLEAQLRRFEKAHDMKSAAFYAKYETGELGDSMDFIEWASTLDMLKNAEKRLALLKQGTDL